jgi:hypothetical protein
MGGGGRARDRAPSEPVGTWWVSSPYLLTPSSPSSWCGCGGRGLVAVRAAAVDDPRHRVDGRTGIGVPRWTERWTSCGRSRHGAGAGPGRPRSRVPGRRRPVELSTTGHRCPPNRAVCPHEQPPKPVHSRPGLVTRNCVGDTRPRLAAARPRVVARLRWSHKTAFVGQGRRWEGAAEDRKRAHFNVRERGPEAATRPASFLPDSLTRRRLARGRLRSRAGARRSPPTPG